MDYLVEFLESGGARVIKDPLLIAKKRDLPNVLLSPDISHLTGVSPSFWVREGDTIGAKHPQESLKQVLEHLSENHSFTTENDKLFSPDSKFILKIEEIDARREKDMHNVLRAMSHDKKEVLKNIEDLDEKYIQVVKILEREIEKTRHQMMKVSFVFFLMIILLKLI
jgi:hypothetical protein